MCIFGHCPLSLHLLKPPTFAFGMMLPRPAERQARCKDKQVSQPQSISSGVAGRYAGALFNIALEENAVDQLASNLAVLVEAFAQSTEFRTLVTSPAFSAAEQVTAINAVAGHYKMFWAVGSTLGLMAHRRRLFVLPHFLRQLRRMIANHKGEVEVELVSARELAQNQIGRVHESLKKRLGEHVVINARVDPALIGGLVIKLGSRMVDASVRARLNNLQSAMEKVG